MSHLLWYYIFPCKLSLARGELAHLVALTACFCSGDFRDHVIRSWANDALDGVIRRVSQKKEKGVCSALLISKLLENSRDVAVPGIGAVREAVGVVSCEPLGCPRAGSRQDLIPGMRKGLDFPMSISGWL